MKFVLALLTTFAVAAAAKDALYIPDSDQTCYKVMDGDHDAHFECKDGHLDDAPDVSTPPSSPFHSVIHLPPRPSSHSHQLKFPPPQARDVTTPAEERAWAEGHLNKRGSCMFGLHACKASCWNMGCHGGACPDGRWGVCKCSC